MKKIPILLLLLIASMGMQAKTTNILVWLATGEKITYSLAEHPKVMPGKENVRITTTEVDIVYPVGEVHKITYDEATDIGQSALEADKGSVGITDNVMSLSGFAAGETVRIFDAAGRLAGQYKTDATGALRINLSEFEKGVYIVKTNHQSSKFIRK
ncbi:MAG: T9SS type A sorting domain-containing protein [Prevotella sp.]|nr:T9SS type A sorting domain-containing protein [Prevotella sp.]